MLNIYKQTKKKRKISLLEVRNLPEFFVETFCNCCISFTTTISFPEIGFYAFQECERDLFSDGFFGNNAVSCMKEGQRKVSTNEKCKKTSCTAREKWRYSELNAKVFTAVPWISDSMMCLFFKIQSPTYLTSSSFKVYHRRKVMKTSKRNAFEVWTHINHAVEWKVIIFLWKYPRHLYTLPKNGWRL